MLFMRLIICGNGFDISHGLKTKYSDYKETGLKNHERIKSDFENFPWFLIKNNCEIWRDVEESLTIDIEEMIKNIKQNYIEDNKLIYDELKTDIEGLTEFVYFFTGELFYNWLSSIDYSGCHKKQFIEELFKDAIGITFNYTSTLEDVYKIEDSKVLHIHGALKNVDGGVLQSNNICPSCSTIEEIETRSDEIVLSQRFNNDIIKAEIQFGFPRVLIESIIFDFRKTFGEKMYKEVEECTNINEFVEAASKRIEENIPKLILFLEGKEIDEIVIMGHSLGGPDDLYYEQVLVPLFKDKKWIIFVHSKVDTKFAERNGLRNVEYRNWSNEVIEIN